MANQLHIARIFFAGILVLLCTSTAECHVHERLRSTQFARDLTEIRSNCSLTAEIRTYPGYTGPLKAYGRYRVKFFDDGYLTAMFNGRGLQPSCLLCGVHIHVGTSCEDAALVGSHYYNTTALTADPWTTTYGATYNSNSMGFSFAGYTINSGYDCEANRGHAVVVHAQDGTTRYGCGILK